LAEILPIESADMYCDYDVQKHEYYPMVMDEQFDDTCIRAWSLAALLKLIPNFNMFKRTIECRIETTNHFVDKACEPIDAAFEMVCWLKKEEYI
jgi:hypothetical protein